MGKKKKSKNNSKRRIKRHLGKDYKIDKDHFILNFKGISKLEKLVEEVCIRSSKDITISSRDRELVYLRALYFKLAIELTPYSYEVIGAVCNRDHATVTHGIDKKWPEIELHRPDIVELYDQIINGISESEYIHLKIMKLNNKIDYVNNKLSRIKEEIESDTISAALKLVNIKRVAYNEELS